MIQNWDGSCKKVYFQFLDSLNMGLILSLSKNQIKITCKIVSSRKQVFVWIYEQIWICWCICKLQPKTKRTEARDRSTVSVRSKQWARVVGEEKEDGMVVDQDCRSRGGGARGHAIPQILTDQLNLNQGADYVHHHITFCPPGFSDLPTALDLVAAWSSSSIKQNVPRVNVPTPIFSHSNQPAWAISLLLAPCLKQEV